MECWITAPSPNCTPRSGLGMLRRRNRYSHRHPNGVKLRRSEIFIAIRDPNDRKLRRSGISRRYLHASLVEILKPLNPLDDAQKGFTQLRTTLTPRRCGHDSMSLLRSCRNLLMTQL